jgi:hypothetical protein
MITSPTASGAMPARLTASLIAIAPSSGADRDDSPPRNLPIGVRAAEMITGIRDLSFIFLSYRRGMVLVKINRQNFWRVAYPLDL